MRKINSKKTIDEPWTSSGQEGNVSAGSPQLFLLALCMGQAREWNSGSHRAHPATIVWTTNRSNRQRITRCGPDAGGDRFRGCQADVIVCVGVWLNWGGNTIGRKLWWSRPAPTESG